MFLTKNLSFIFQNCSWTLTDSRKPNICCWISSELFYRVQFSFFISLVHCSWTTYYVRIFFNQLILFVLKNAVHFPSISLEFFTEQLFSTIVRSVKSIAQYRSFNKIVLSVKNKRSYFKKFWFKLIQVVRPAFVFFKTKPSFTTYLVRLQNYAHHYESIPI